MIIANPIYAFGSDHRIPAGTIIEVRYIVYT
jgi:hypothetical protein